MVVIIFKTIFNISDSWYEHRDLSNKAIWCIKDVPWGWGEVLVLPTDAFQSISKLSFLKQLFILLTILSLCFEKCSSEWFTSDINGMAWVRMTRIHFQDDIFPHVSGAWILIGFFFSPHGTSSSRWSHCSLGFSQHASFFMAPILP